MDTVYVNGQQIGASSWVENPRNYGARGLKPGRNVIAIRLYRLRTNGGFLSKPEELRLVLGDGKSIPLAGEWKGKVAVDGHPPQVMPIAPENLDSMPAVLYNGMIAPMIPLSITGAIWYQGESNSERAFQYRTLLPALIADWRKQFGQGDFPFYIVSLPGYMHHRDTPGDDSWAELREAQILTAKTVPHTCVAIMIDTGDPDNIHPIDKVQVGDRLGYCALAEHYGQKIPYIGPRFTSMERATKMGLPKNGMELHFDHTDGGLVVKGDKVGEFQIAGADRKWYWADAAIEVPTIDVLTSAPPPTGPGGEIILPPSLMQEETTVIVSSQSVPEPVAVRYAWQSYPVATLFNGAGLPAEPFRTDDWPEMTAGHEIYGNDPRDQGVQ
jgi:sialate O-acetylesterase